MIQIIKSQDRHRSELSWLTSYFHFSFSDYYDPTNVHWGTLRVVNDDYIKPNSGFGAHPHENMEIVSYVINGELTHQDSLGNIGKIRAGEVQRMTAGTGVVHAEFNQSPDTEVHMLQMWVFPREQNLKPGWEQRGFTKEQRQGRLLPVVSGSPTPGALHIHQDVTLYISALDAGKSVEHSLGEGRYGYLFVIDGELTLNGQNLSAGDQGRIKGEQKLSIAATSPAELILWDLA